VFEQLNTKTIDYTCGIDLEPVRLRFVTDTKGSNLLVSYIAIAIAA
jgi:hypothetical protein